MGYLICDKCGGYYELQPGEKLEDFDLVCDCGGKLTYSENYEQNIKEVEEHGNTIICPYCGSENPYDKKMCQSCRKLLIPITRLENPDKANIKYPSKSKDGFMDFGDQTNKIKIIGIIGALIIVLLLIIGISALFVQDKTSSNTPNSYSSNNSTQNVQATWHSVANFTQSDINVVNNATHPFSLKGNQSMLVISATAGDYSPQYDSLIVELCPEGQQNFIQRGTLDNFNYSDKRKTIEVHVNAKPGNYYLKVNGYVNYYHIEVLDYY